MHKRYIWIRYIIKLRDICLLYRNEYKQILSVFLCIQLVFRIFNITLWIFRCMSINEYEIYKYVNYISVFTTSLYDNTFVLVIIYYNCKYENLTYSQTCMRINNTYIKDCNYIMY